MWSAILTSQISKRLPQDQRERYKNLLQETDKPWCWCCGRSESDVPSNWHAPFMIERAHIVNKPRVELREVVILLCSLCHQLEHQRNAKHLGITLPAIEIDHMVWMKLVHDPEYFSPEILRKYSVRAIPDPVPIPQVYQDEYARRTNGPCRVV